MKEFIIDVNIDARPQEAGYPDYFFDDLRSAKSIRIVIGGTNYKREILRKSSLKLLIEEMISSGKIRSVKDSDVDEFERLFGERILGVLGTCPEQCDDHHIFALAKISGCVNVISKDARMAACRDLIRGRIGHDCCPSLRVISTQNAYRDS